MMSPEQKKEYQANYYKKHLEQAKEAGRLYRKTEKYKELRREYRKKHPWRNSKEYDRMYRIKKIYNLSPEAHSEMIMTQGNCCAICGDQFREKKTKHKHPCVDHDHKTGKLRGILCSSCNLLIGYANDSEDVLEKAIKYLRKYSST